MKAYIGKHVEFTDLGELIDLDSFEKGMRAKLVEATLKHPGEDEYWELVFDFSFWEEYNKQFSKANWWKGNELVKWHESPFYPKNCIEKMCYSPDGVDVLFNVLPMGEIEERASKVIEMVQALIMTGNIADNYCSDYARQEIMKTL